MANIGDKFGQLTIIESLGFIKGRTTFSCKCDCGQLKNVRSDCLKKGNVKSCGCLNTKRGSLNRGYKGYEQISGRLLASIKHGARKRNLTFLVTPEQMWTKFLIQKKKCVYSGLELKLPSTTLEERTASLDRIDSSRGYELDNIQWVHKDVNVMKQDFSEEKFLDLIRKIHYHSS